MALKLIAARWRAETKTDLPSRLDWQRLGEKEHDTID